MSDRSEISAWVCFALASGLLAAILTAPRAAQHQALLQRWQSAQTEIDALQSDVRELERLEAALQNDAQFVARLAEQELRRPGRSERMPLDSSLAIAWKSPSSHPIPAPKSAAAKPEVRFAGSFWFTALATDGPWRRRAIGAVVGLLALSCVPWWMKTRPADALRDRLAGRYFHPSPPAAAPLPLEAERVTTAATSYSPDAPAPG